MTSPTKEDNSVVVMDPKAASLPRLPDWVPPAASDLNDVADASRTKQEVASPNVPLPVIYGRDRVQGRVAVVHVDDAAGMLYIMFVFAEPSTSIDKVFVDNIDVDDATNGLLAKGGAIEYHAAGGDASSLLTVISGYADTPNACHVVVKIPKTYARSFPRVEAIIKGRAVYDPRVPTTAYSSNPVLAFADLAVRSGRSVNWASVTTGANYCDEVLGGEPRRSIGLTLAEPRSLEDWAKAFRVYTGCFIVWENGEIRFIPDKAETLPNDLVKDIVSTDDIVADSVRLTRKNPMDFPTMVIVEYRDSSDDNNWRTERAIAEASGVTSHRVSRVSLPGIHSYAQAYREAVERLNKFYADLSIEFTLFDEGLELQIGSLLRISHPLGFDKYFRVNSLGVEQARWRVLATEYDPTVYSDSTPTLPAAYVPETGTPESPAVIAAPIFESSPVSEYAPSVPNPSDTADKAFLLVDEFPESTTNKYEQYANAPWYDYNYGYTLFAGLPSDVYCFVAVDSGVIRDITGAHTLTQTGSNVATSSESKWPGYESIYFNPSELGYNNNLLINTDNDDADEAGARRFQWNGAWTLELWVKPTYTNDDINAEGDLRGIAGVWGASGYYTSTSAGLFHIYYSGFYKRAYFWLYNPFYWLFDNFDSETLISATGSVQPDSWTHIAVTKDESGNVRMFVNGVVATNATKSGGPTSIRTDPTSTLNWISTGVPRKISLGESELASTYAWQGYIQEFAFTRKCKYRENFTPPTQPLFGYYKQTFETIHTGNLPKTLLGKNQTVTAKWQFDHSPVVSQHVDIASQHYAPYRDGDRDPLWLCTQYQLGIENGAPIDRVKWIYQHHENANLDGYAARNWEYRSTQPPGSPDYSPNGVTLDSRYGKMHVSTTLTRNGKPSIDFNGDYNGRIVFTGTRWGYALTNAGTGDSLGWGFWEGYFYFKNKGSMLDPVFGFFQQTPLTTAGRFSIWRDDNLLYMDLYDGATYRRVTKEIPLNTWCHVVWGRDKDGNWAIFVDGSKSATTISYSGYVMASPSINSVQVLGTAFFSDTSYPEFAVSDFRFVRSAYPYTKDFGNFTPPYSDKEFYYPNVVPAPLLSAINTNHVLYADSDNTIPAIREPYLEDPLSMSFTSGLFTDNVSVLPDTIDFSGEPYSYYVPNPPVSADSNYDFWFTRKPQFRLGQNTTDQGDFHLLGFGDLTNNPDKVIFRISWGGDADDNYWPLFTAYEVRVDGIYWNAAADPIVDTPVWVKLGTETGGEGYVLETRAIATAAGLTGGGSLEANRTIALDFNGLNAETAPAPEADYVAVYDNSASAHRKMLLRDLPGARTLVNNQTDSYTLQLSDSSKYVRLDKGTALDLTVPPDSSVSFPIGTIITIRQVGIGQVTVVEGSGVTVLTATTKKLRAQNSSASLVKVGTDTWDLAGDLASS